MNVIASDAFIHELLQSQEELITVGWVLIASIY
jgi:hypothetical protein